MMAHANQTWLRLDQLENAIDSLEMVRHFLISLHGHIRWKWATIALHQALYGFAVCATKPTDSSWALKKPDDPESQLVDIWTALKRARDPTWMPRYDWVPLVTSPAEDEAIERIVTEFRNEFEHFRPKAWAIEVSGMPELFQDVLRVIRHLALDSNTVTYVDDELRDRVSHEIILLDEQLVKDASA